MDFIKNNLKTIVQLGFALFVIYWLVFILTPVSKMTEVTAKKIDSLNNLIQQRELEQKKLDSNILFFNNEIKNIDNNISKIKSEKTIVKEYYHEKINDVDKYTDVELDSFFAVRYRYYTK
jgi:septal ring factor EnvC (AmiA/AmiB activator)